MNPEVELKAPLTANHVAFSAAQTATVDAVQVLLIDGLLKRLTWGRRFCVEPGNSQSQGPINPSRL
jgi:hypothetical protein